jgi:serine/threonine-protein kinase
MDQTVPTGRIGRYVVQGELGRGAMGVVYRAQDPTIGRVVAIKTIRIGQFTDPAELKHVRERMMREAQAAGMLSHNNIVTIYDILEETDTAYIFMEYVDGETLEKILLADTPIDQQLMLWILRQAAEALDYAHARGIVHRDIKPANIMVRRDGIAKIADFGIARVQSQSMTQTGQVLGTPNYMSPEHISGKAVDGKADQYSLAVMLYEVLTGEKPFVADSLATLLFKVVSENPAPMPRMNPTLSPQIDDVLQRALAKAPTDRFSTCSEFVRALERACNATPGWRTLVRGGGLTQPTQEFAPVAAPQPVVNKPVVIPQTPTPVAQPVVIPPTPTPLAQPVAVPPKPAASINWILVAALAGVLVLLGAGAIGAKFYLDKKQPVEEPPAVVVDAPVTKQPDKPTPAKPVAAKPDIGKPDVQKADDTQPAAAAMAVAIRSTPEGARVIIDDGKVPPCTSPCLLELPVGRHAAVITLEDFKTEMRIFNVPQDSSVSVTMEKKKGMLEVNSTPPGATISIDGAEHPQKTPALIPLVIGKHTVTLTVSGKPPYSQTFEMRADATISLHPNWGN